MKEIVIQLKNLEKNKKDFVLMKVEKMIEIETELEMKMIELQIKPKKFWLILAWKWALAFWICITLMGTREVIPKVNVISWMI